MTYRMKAVCCAVAVCWLVLGICWAQESSPAVPEAGFISPEKYTNAFFGFTLPLPQDPAFIGFQVPSKGDAHTLYGLQAHTKNRLGLTAFLVTATRRDRASSDQARAAASAFKPRAMKPMQLSGKELWKGESAESGVGGKMRTILYATAINGYVLEFQITSFDGRLTKELEQCVEAVQFYEPGKSREMAGADSRPYDPRASQSLIRADVPFSNRIGQLSMGEVAGETYRNDALGFTYMLPAGWVTNDKAIQDRTMEAGHQFAFGDSPTAARQHTAFQQCARVLLIATRYPVGAKIEEVNPMIVIIAVDSACFPGAHFPTSINDQELIKETARQMLHDFAGTPFVSSGENSVYAFVVQDHLIVNISSSFQVGPSGTNTPRDIYSSMEVTQLDNYWVAWGFLSGSASDLQELKATQIAFVPAK
jgi:hypothetical protein